MVGSEDYKPRYNLKFPKCEQGTYLWEIVLPIITYHDLTMNLTSDNFKIGAVCLLENIASIMITYEWYKGKFLAHTFATSDVVKSRCNSGNLLCLINHSIFGLIEFIPYGKYTWQIFCLLICAQLNILALKTFLYKLHLNYIY